jgi:antitoxin ParD1/3/4
VISKALALLEQAQLEKSYREASKELDNDFDTTIFDGLKDETW